MFFVVTLIGATIVFGVDGAAMVAPPAQRRPGA